MSVSSRFYITTPIFYVNDAPHIGHAYTEVAADVLARWNRKDQKDTWFLTGTDEHGQKILRTATAHGMEPKEWADRLVEREWRPLLDLINISNDDFIRTTDERHEQGVARFLQNLYDSGYIYAGEFEALYCVGCEEFKPKSEIEDGSGEFEGKKVCQIHSKPLELLQEKNYFFKMSAFQDRLLKLYEENPDFIQPASARNEVVAFVQQGLSDLSISRTSFDWGVPIPWDRSHVTYVWFDALLNYLTAVDGLEDSAPIAGRWPATVHLVGKDILRFHAVIWPAMLMAAGLELPEKIFAHGWLLVGGEKMSKSKLTGIAPSEITSTFGVDAFRYYFMRAINFGQDGSFSWEDIAARYQGELGNGFGNLVSRVLGMARKYFDGIVPDGSGGQTEAEERVRALVAEVVENARAAMGRCEIHEGLGQIWRVVDELNLYVTEQEPWVLAKSGREERLAAVIGALVEGLRVLAELLYPFIPASCEKVWEALGGEDALGSLAASPLERVAQWGRVRSGTALGELPVLFPRVESVEE